MSYHFLPLVGEVDPPYDKHYPKYCWIKHDERVARTTALSYIYLVRTTSKHAHTHRRARAVEGGRSRLRVCVACVASFTWCSLFSSLVSCSGVHIDLEKSLRVQSHSESTQAELNLAYCIHLHRGKQEHKSKSPTMTLRPLMHTPAPLVCGLPQATSINELNELQCRAPVVGNPLLSQVGNAACSRWPFQGVGAPLQPSPSTHPLSTTIDTTRTHCVGIERLRPATSTSVRSANGMLAVPVISAQIPRTYQRSVAFQPPAALDQRLPQSRPDQPSPLYPPRPMLLSGRASSQPSSPPSQQMPLPASTKVSKDEACVADGRTLLDMLQSREISPLHVAGNATQVSQAERWAALEARCKLLGQHLESSCVRIERLAEDKRCLERKLSENSNTIRALEHRCSDQNTSLLEQRVEHLQGTVVAKEQRIQELEEELRQVQCAQRHGQC